MISYGPYIKSIIQKILILSKSEDIEEIREDRKVLSKTQSFGNAYIFFTELGEVYGSDKVSYETVRKWRK